jgi:dTMP kinase
MHPLFISFEGLEGSGKSTQAGLLASRLKEAGYEVVVTREPGGSRIGEQIRAITHARDNVDLTATAEAYLMAASRAQHVREIIRPALQTNKIVICDRFLDSSLSYQGYGRELGEETIKSLNALAVESVTPDLTFLLQVTPEVGHTRRNGERKIDRLDLQQKDFYQRVYDGYQKLAQKHKERFVVIDATREIETVSEEIYQTIHKHLS